MNRRLLALSAALVLAAATGCHWSVDNAYSHQCGGGDCGPSGCGPSGCGGCGGCSGCGLFSGLGHGHGGGYGYGPGYGSPYGYGGFSGGYDSNHLSGDFASGLIAAKQGGGGYPFGHHRQAGEIGPPTPQTTYPYYTTRGPRDFFLNEPMSIGP